MKLANGQIIIAKLDMPPLLTKGDKYCINNLDDTWKTFSFYGNNWKITVLEQARLDTYFELPAPVSIEPDVSCTCGAAHVQGRHSGWCDVKRIKL